MMKNKTNTIKSGTIYLLISSGVFMFCGYLISIWLGRELGPINYGIYGVIISLMTAVNIIQMSGLPQATSKFIASGKYNTDVILRASLQLQTISTLILTSLFFVFAYPISILLKDIELVNYIRVTAFILPFYAIFSLYSSYYNGLRDFKKQALINIVYSIAKVISVVGLVYIFHLYGAIIGFIISPIIALLLGFYIPKTVFIDKKIYRSLITFSVPLIGFAILSTLMLSTDLFFVKALLNDESTGLYSASQNIARIPYFALNAFATMLLPVISRSVNTESAKETGKKIKEILRYQLIFLIPGTVLISISSSQLIEFLFSKSYTPATSSLSWLVIGLGFITIFMALANIITAMGKPFMTMIISAGGVLFTAFFCWYLIPLFGLVGASIATTIGGIFAMILSFIVVSCNFPKILNILSVLKIFLATAIMFAVHKFIHLSVILLPLTYIILGGVYCISLLALREITLKDLSILKKVLPKKLFNNNIKK